MRFLEQVAEAYCGNEIENLIDYCFVFPNKRSCRFFADALSRYGHDKTFVRPEIVPINEFVAGFSPEMVEATRYEQLFILYNEYSRLSQDIEDFDRFRFWGEMLLNDFSDVDSYMADAAQLFTNVKRLREINANYLTPEQLEVIERFWGEIPTGYNPDEFWTHLDAPGGERFLKLWEILTPLYHNFRETMERNGLANTGMLSRRCVETLSHIGVNDLYFKRYIFVGFNVLSTSETLIFEKLKALGAADFYWDYASPAFSDKDNKAVRFISRNVKEFKSLYELNEEAYDRLPDIEIIGVPSRMGQTKVAGEILSDWVRQGVTIDRDNAIDTAVVLPDEQLFVPMLHAIPSEISRVNVTMGYPMRHTPIASVMRTVVSMHLRAHSVKGRFLYFYEDLLQLISQPLIYSTAPDDCDKIRDMINGRHLFNVPAETLTESCPKLAPIFTPVSDPTDYDEVYAYSRNLALFMLDAVEKGYNGELDRLFIKSYIESLETLDEACRRHSVKMNENTFFHLIESALSTETINFTGEPLTGLQIMGVLETRALDFDNLIMLSMNERIFPRRHYTRSFIPDALRRAYGLSTVDFQESIYAYYFYRLLTRARNVKLLYDARSVGGKSSEMSRFLVQLLYLYSSKGNIIHTLRNYTQRLFEKPEVEIAKTPAIMDKLHEYTIDGSNRNFSASSINEYLNCPLNFYLKYIEGLNVEEDASDFMDSSTFGTIVHEVLDNLYSGHNKKTGNTPVTAEILNEWKESPTILDNLLTYSINKNYNKLSDERLNEPLFGETEILARLMKMFLCEMLEREKEFAPLTFIAGEYPIKTRWKINDGLTINIKQYIDRIDRLSDGRYRIVDYKTGGDDVKAASVDALFDTTAEKRPKAMLQLMFYCMAYAREAGIEDAIQPYLYCFKRIKVDGLPPLQIAKEPILDYRVCMDEYLPRFNSVIEEIFNPDIPFRQASHESACTFCQFKGVCVKEENKRY